ncbi:MAG TPA: hypothetical protein VN452_05775 [Longilinea sp.]|nr:hypothetical protein [Longilinea sp.]
MATPLASSSSGIGASPNPAINFAQATMDYGQSQLLDLSRRATQTSLDMAQSANDSALSTQDFNRRQKMDLDYQSTIISMNITQAAATQQSLLEQTNLAMQATAVAQSIAATASQSAYLVIVNQTEQAQAILDTQIAQTNQAVIALTAYPLTATPFAITQAALLVEQHQRDRQSFIDHVITPSIPILASIVLVLFIIVAVMIDRRALLSELPRRFRIARFKNGPSPLTVIDGVIVDHDPRLDQINSSELIPANPPRLQSENSVHVEIVDATKPPVDQWIADVERQLAAEKRSLP